MARNQTHFHFDDAASRPARRIAVSLGITAAFVVVEIMAGIVGNSLALLTDAAHNVTDVIALGLSWYALRLAVKPANAGNTYGYHRAGILVALINATTLLVIAVGIFYGAYQRFRSPVDVNTSILVGVGIIALLINAGTAWLVHEGSTRDLNLRSTFLHLLGDVLSTLGAVIAGVLIAFTGWNWLDPLVSVLIGALILWNAWGVLRQTIQILLESTPENIDLQEMVHDLLQVKGVQGVHDLHVWSISQNLRMFSAHILTADVPISVGASIQNGINEVLSRKYGVQHTTLQFECEGCESNILFCEIGEHDFEKPRT